MARVNLKEVEELLDKEFKVLNKGFVRLIDYMGSDESIVQAARVSYGKGTKQVSEDRGLIRYLMRHKHTTPFEMVEFKFHVKLPIFVARQWIRHRTASVNEYSGRYSIMEDEFFVPLQEAIQFQSTSNKQGRSDEEVPAELQQKVIEILSQGQGKSYQDYEELLKSGIARELARVNLPLSLYTQWYWKINLHNLLHFLKLRLDEHAQQEFREYAQVIAEIVKKVVPVTYEAFEDFELHSLEFSKKELLVLKECVKIIDIPAGIPEKVGLKGRELSEFLAKIDRINNL
ncbi:MAG: FAD-dependent thymidylate synthase [Patescibacteria group bacterium]|nr:FAD-dependent thymidylate synthase [Patescibacteria group bacterium]